MVSESAVVFDCHEDRLVGVAHLPENPASVGVVIVVGGPQYRAGSHRQFTQMARKIAREGYAVLRFDYRGMGDSDGAERNFDSVDDDIRAAIDALVATATDVTKVVLLGLCDAASANLIYAPMDSRVGGLVLLNPWAHTEAGEARAYVRHYYLQRFVQRSFWKKVFSGDFALRASVRDLFRKIALARNGRQNSESLTVQPSDYLVRMEHGLRSFDGPILIHISGRDLTAAEFLEWSEGSTGFKDRAQSGTTQIEHFRSADHTMSGAEDLDASIAATICWLDSRFRKQDVS